MKRILFFLFFFLSYFQNEVVEIHEGGKTMGVGGFGHGQSESLTRVPGEISLCSLIRGPTSNQNYDVLYRFTANIQRK